MKKLWSWALAAWAVVACQPPAEQNTSYPFRNPELPRAERIADLLGRLTPEEKIDQLLYDAPAIERLGIPAYNWWNECLHGVGRAGIATVFPQAIGLAATWDTALVHELANITATEARAKHRQFLDAGQHGIYQGLTFWTPNINIFRDPRWGRGQETYGEDPHLTARMAVALITGLQGSDPEHLKLVATAKHFAVHSGPESTRHSFDAQPSRQDLYETYLPAFFASVVEAQAASVMCAYNRLDGKPCCGSNPLLEGILRNEMGFKGYVVSDCWALVDFYEPGRHGVSPDAPSAAALALQSGTDLNCGSVFPFLKEALKQGLVKEEDLDRALTRLLDARFRLGMFDPPGSGKWPNPPASVIAQATHAQQALQAAHRSIVLLKNDGVLPLKPNAKVAVIGPNADEYQVMLGNYHGTPTEVDTPLRALRREQGLEVLYAEGCDLAANLPAMQPIPTEALRTPDGQPGLLANYYDNQSWSGQPVRSATDPNIHFWWAGKGPIRGAVVDTFSVSWEGTIIPPVSGTYTIALDAANIGELYLNDTLATKFKNDHHAQRNSVKVNLQQGVPVPVKVRVRNYGADPQAHLFWGYHDPQREQKALETARQADVVLFFGGLSPHIEGEEMPVKIEGFDGGDRTLIELPRPQRDLLAKLVATGKPVVMVNMSGSAVALPEALLGKLSGMLQLWYPGQAGGIALADILSGRVSPSGRLPVTFYRQTQDLPAFDDYRMNGRTYRYFEKPVQFPFGFGLSYGRFEYEGLKVTDNAAATGQEIEVQVLVKNTGQMAADEVVQLYVSTPAAGKGAPLRSLKKFTRVTLAPGATQQLTFRLAPKDLAMYNQDGKPVQQPGAYSISVGGCQPVSPAPATTSYQTIRLSLSGEAVTL